MTEKNALSTLINSLQQSDTYKQITKTQMRIQEAYERNREDFIEYALTIIPEGENTQYRANELVQDTFEDALSMHIAIDDDQDIITHLRSLMVYILEDQKNDLIKSEDDLETLEQLTTEEILHLTEIRNAIIMAKQKWKNDADKITIQDALNDFIDTDHIPKRLLTKLRKNKLLQELYNGKDNDNKFELD